MVCTIGLYSFNVGIDGGLNLISRSRAKRMRRQVQHKDVSAWCLVGRIGIDGGLNLISLSRAKRMRRQVRHKDEETEPKPKLGALRPE